MPRSNQALHQRFQKQLFELRRKSGITQAELARRLARPQSFISKVELGERRLDVVEFIEFIEALGEDPQEQLKRFLLAATGKRTR